jgi:hypothetical protein
MWLIENIYSNTNTSRILSYSRLKEDSTSANKLRSCSILRSISLFSLSLSSMLTDIVISWSLIDLYDDCTDMVSNYTGIKETKTTFVCMQRKWVFQKYYQYWSSALLYAKLPRLCILPPSKQHIPGIRSLS